ncbi:MAG: SAM-dependent chlorinase/fluorinase [Spirochaetota bacterium]|nr:SAM-dependent chlorinase/fluorinase [Spirochaetota bacterium]
MIAIMTDFGTWDASVASMKGVIKSINPSVELVDISHDISEFSIREGAFVLNRCYSYFPKGTIFLCVVDPGVGSKRRAIVLKSNDYYFVAPDNGLLSYIVEDSKSIKVYNITNPKYMLADISSTFHGRDIFAPTAAYLSLGIDISSFGEELKDIIIFSISIAKEINNNEIEGEIIFFDQYGNAYTNIKKELFKSKFTSGFYEVYINDTNINKFKMSTCFTDVEIGCELIYFGSSNLLELAKNSKSLQNQYLLKLGDKIKLIKV